MLIVVIESRDLLELTVRREPLSVRVMNAPMRFPSMSMPSTVIDLKVTPFDFCEYMVMELLELSARLIIIGGVNDANTFWRNSSRHSSSSGIGSGYAFKSLLIHAGFRNLLCELKLLCERFNDILITQKILL